MIRRRCTGRGVCGTQLRASRFVTTVRCRHRPARVRRHRLACMSFRVLVIGGRRFCDNARLRDALDRALVNRLPDVELLTAGGPGVPALAASYARSRGLTLTVLTTDYIRYPGDAREHRDGQLVALADAPWWCGRTATGTCGNCSAGPGRSISRSSSSVRRRAD